MVMTWALSSLTAVWSPLTIWITGARPETATPLQSAILTLTGNTWPFLSLSLTGWSASGGSHVPVPTLTDVLFVSEPPSLSVTVTVAVRLQPGAKVWSTFWPVVNGKTVWVAGRPDDQVKSALWVSTVPGSRKSVLNVLGANTSGPAREFVPVKLVIVGPTFVTVTVVS